MKFSANPKIISDTAILKRDLRGLPRTWNACDIIPWMQRRPGCQWKQVEWWAFYLECKCEDLLKGRFAFPGEKFVNTVFYLQRHTNWDLKGKAINGKNGRAMSDAYSILNDRRAVEKCIEQRGALGITLACCSVTFEEDGRPLTSWVLGQSLGQSVHDIVEEQRRKGGRLRKTQARLEEILFLEINHDNVDRLSEFRQGRNADRSSSRESKFKIDTKHLDRFKVGEIKF